MKVLSKKKNRNKSPKDKQKDNNISLDKNNPINKNNIMNYFVFDENENNIIGNAKEKKILNNKIIENEEKKKKNKEQRIKAHYNVNSFITSNYRPDLYSPYGIISGNKYRLKKAPDQNSRKIEEVYEECEENEIKKSEEEKDNDKEELSSSWSSNEKDELKNKKLNRYFNIEPDITVKCHTCGQVGHRKDICPKYNIKFCYRCLSSNHEDRDCDKIKCFRCNKLGHKTYNCQLKDNQLIICDRCHCVGHRKNECLIKPLEFSHKFLKYNNLYCLNCGSNKHILCPLTNRELPELFENEQDDILLDDSISLNLNNSDNDDDKSSLTPNNEEINQPKNIEIKKEKKIFNDLDNEDIKYTSFCGFCGGRHRNDECHEKIEDKFNNKFDEQRKSLGKKIIEKREKEREEEENRRYISSFERNRNNKDNKSYQKNQETKNNKKYNYRFKDKSKSIGINKIINLNEDEPSENENCYNNKNSKNKIKTSKNNNYRNYNKSKSQNKNNKNMKINTFSS